MYFFDLTCSQRWKERTSEVIDLRVDDPNAVHCMIQYFYSLMYPSGADNGDSARTAAVSKTAFHTIPSDNYIHLTKQDFVDKSGRVNTSYLNTVEDTLMEEEENLQRTTTVSSDTGNVQQTSSAKYSRDLKLGRLHQDLLVYALSEKYGIPDLKKQAAHHFDQELQQTEMTIDVFDIIGEVYLTTPSQDRGLRDMVVAKVYGEVQHWVKDQQFMKTLSCEGDFCTDLLAYTVKEDLKRYEAALANIDHPGYCGKCQATLILKRWVSRRKNVNIEKYCAKCDPWH